MGFQKKEKKFRWGWVGGVRSIQFFLMNELILRFDSVFPSHMLLLFLFSIFVVFVIIWLFLSLRLSLLLLLVGTCYSLFYNIALRMAQHFGVQNCVASEVTQSPNVSH